MRTRCAALATVTALMALTSACDLRRGRVESRPGETTAELAAAGEVLEAVGDSVPLISVRVAAASGTQERRTVGVVVGDNRRVLVDAKSLSLDVGDGEDAEVAHTRSIAAIFHPGGPKEERLPAEVVRENGDRGLALLSVQTDIRPPALELGDDLPDGARVYLIGIPLNMTRLAVESGEVRGYEDTDSGRFLVHTAGHEPDVTGPVVDSEGNLIGLQMSGVPRERMAIPAVEIARWLQTPDRGEMPPSEPGRVLDRVLREMDVDYRASEAGDGFVLPRRDGPDLLLRQREGIVSVRADLETFHVGDAVEGLRSNYSDPLGAIALRPTGGDEQVTWIARLPADALNAAYLSYVAEIAVIQAARWRQLQAGMEPDYPYEHYPGGDETAHQTRLAEIVTSTSIPSEASGDGYKLEPSAAVPVFTNVFRGMAYVYAYSGGLPGEGASGQEQVAEELLRRNWELPLGRLALDKHLDLAWEAQVPMEHLTAEYLTALVRVCQAEVARIKSTWGDVPFNEQ